MEEQREIKQPISEAVEPSCFGNPSFEVTMVGLADQPNLSLPTTLKNGVTFPKEEINCERATVINAIFYIPMILQ